MYECSGVLLGLAVVLGTPAEAKPVEVLIGAAPTTFHPLYGWTREDIYVRDRVHESLFEPDGQGGWRSDVVTDVGVDGTRVTLTLAKRRWSDGTAFEPSDVCTTIARVKATDRPTPYTTRANATIAACEVGGKGAPSQVIVTLTAPRPEPRAVLDLPLVPTHAPEWAGAGPQNAMAPIGLGWFAAEPAAGVVHLTQLGGPSPYKKLDVVVVPDPAKTLAEGRGIGAPFVDPASLAVARGATDVELTVTRPPGVWMLMVNAHRGPLADPLVRDALDRMIDREALAAALLGRDPELSNQAWAPVSGPFPPKSPLASGGVPVTLRDMDGARASLEEAGLVRGPDGVWTWGGAPWRLRVVTPAGVGPDPERLRVALGQQLDGIGVDVVALSSTQWWYSFLTGGHTEASDLALLPVALDDVRATFHSRSATEGWANPFSYTDPEVDDWLEAQPPAGALFDTDTAHLVHARLADEHVALFLWAIEGRSAWRSGATPP